jgi:cellulose synthase (UDP-forming)
MSSNAVAVTAVTRSSMTRAHEHDAADLHARSRRHTTTAGWADLLGAPSAESVRSRDLAHLGGFVALTALVGYLTWRIAYTLPPSGVNAVAAWLLIGFEAIPLVGMTTRLITLWNIDSWAPAPVSEAPHGMRVAVLIPTYDEPAEVIAPTIAAACALQPAHETWVLDDGDRPWVEAMCREYGARYVCRPVHDHAKAGNLNHALDLMAHEAAEGIAEDIDIIAVLDCDHVPLPTFLTATLGWFDDPEIALVQGAQAFYNGGAFDDDGVNGEQGLFFNVLMTARTHRDAGPFWCGSTALLRTAALREIGGVATDTIVEDMHTTLGLLRAGWRTAYHHQTLAVGLAPATADEYLLQRRRWGLGLMQVLVKERLWSSKRYLSWRNYYECFTGAVWWLEGVGTLLLLMIPITLLLSGAQTSTANPWTFSAVFAGTFALRLWGMKRLFRHQLSWPNALALRVLRIPVGLSCLWWLLTRRTLEFQVTPKGGADRRVRGRVPRIIGVLVVCLAAVVVYAVAGLAGLVPWRTSPGATATSGVWLLVTASVLTLGMRRIHAVEFASTRRNSHRFAVSAKVTVNGYVADLVDASVGGVSVRMPAHEGPGPGLVELGLPGVGRLQLGLVRAAVEDGFDPDDRLVSLRVLPGDWAAMRTLSLWLFHTPTGAASDLPRGVPAAASTALAPSLAVRQNRAAAAKVRPAAAAAAVISHG